MNDLFELPFNSSPSSIKKSTRRVFTVSELTTGIRLHLESKYAEVWVEGEISNARVWKTGHLYFTLKDSESQLKAVVFRSTLRYLRFKPSNGQQVIARGRINVYEPKGEYQIVCEHMEPHGVGALQVAFDQLRYRLEQEGLFKKERKRTLPILPRKIGVVTSLDSAAIRDIINILQRRYPNVHLVISPARVQGEGAAEEITRSLRQIGQLPDIDVVIIARGGGSIEDLWAFNEEQVAREIVSTPVPVISAIGHETDYTISDFVSDLRAPTPSAAAELVVARKDEIAMLISRSTERLRRVLQNLLQQRHLVVQQLKDRPGFSGWPARLALHARHVEELTNWMSRSIRLEIRQHERQANVLRRRLETFELGRRLAIVRARIIGAHEQLDNNIRNNQKTSEARLRVVAGRLETLSPLAVLARGYSVCWTADRSIILRDTKTVSPGQKVNVRLHRGELECEVKKVE